jgi:hemerythrin
MKMIFNEKEFRVIVRLKEIIKGRHWYLMDAFTQEAWETTALFRHLKRYDEKHFKKRKYYRRKSYFVPYESHRKKGVDYLPF